MGVGYYIFHLVESGEEAIVSIEDAAYGYAVNKEITAQREEIQRLQGELAEKFSGKCYWCGDIKAGFYHVECAQKMSTGNVEEYKKVVLSLQDTLESTHKKLDEAHIRMSNLAHDKDLARKQRDTADEKWSKTEAELDKLSKALWKIDEANWEPND